MYFMIFPSCIQVLPAWKIHKVVTTGSHDLRNTALRNAGGVVAWTKSTFDDEWTKNMYKGFCDEKVIDLMMSESKVGSFGFEIWDEMDLRNGDIVSEKK